MQLLEALERHLHARNPQTVHVRYDPGRCPYCPLHVNFTALVRSKLPKARSPQP
jgi:hypothetical protein